MCSGIFGENPRLFPNRPSSRKDKPVDSELILSPDGPARIPWRRPGSSI